MTAESPYRRLRLLSGVQQKDLAEQAGISITALTHIEAGTYEKVPERANRALAAVCRQAGVQAERVLVNEYGKIALDAAMRQWQRDQRKKYDLSQFGPVPIETLIAAFQNTNRFCTTLCVPAAVVHNLRIGKYRVLPPVIRDALSEAGYQHIDELEALSVR